MSYLLTQMFLYMLCAFLLGLLLGWLLWRYGKPSMAEFEALQAERDALLKERVDLNTNLDACRTRSSQERTSLEALRAENAELQNRLDAKIVAATPTVAPVAPVAAAPASTGTGTKPKGLTSARNGKADNLQDINGVGPKMESLLNDLGYFHFDQIAAWSTSEVEWVDNNLEGFKGRVTRDSWQSQAKVLAKG